MATGGTAAPAAPRPSTGGTKAPGGKGPRGPVMPSRVQAGVQHLTGMRTQPRSFNPKSGQMETKGQQQTHAARNAPRSNAQHEQQKAAPKSWLQMNPQELLNFAKGQVGSEIKSERVPYQQRASELGNINQTEQNRFAQYGTTSQQTLEGIQKGAEGSAKTFENRAAENAIKAQGEINTSGQNVLTNNGGYVDPQLKQQLEAERANVVGIGENGELRAGEQAQNETNLMANLRAAAAQRVTENQGKAQSEYTKLLGANEAQENKLLARGPGETQKLYTNLLGQQEKYGIAREGLGLKRAETGSKIGERESKAQAARHKEGVETLNAETRRLATVSLAEYHTATVQQKGEMDKANIEYKAASIKTKIEANDIKAAGGGLKPATVNKYVTEISTALGEWERLKAQGLNSQQIRQALTHGSGGYIEVPGAKGGKAKVALEKVQKVSNAVFLDVAEQVNSKRYVDKNVKGELAKLGLFTEGWSNLLLRK